MVKAIKIINVITIKPAIPFGIYIIVTHVIHKKISDVQSFKD